MHIPLSSDQLHQFSFPNPVDDEEAVKLLGLSDWDPLLEKYGLKFKNPQKLAIHYGIAQKKLVLSLDKGAGKTITYLSIMVFGGVKKFLILCSNNAKLTQQKHLDKYFPHLSYVFVEGQDKDKRERLWNSNVNVLIATYATFQADMGGRTLNKEKGTSTKGIIPARVANLPKVFDEAHKVLRRRQSKFFDLIKSIDNPWLIISSGSAGGKGPQDMWAMLHLCNNKMFRGYWPYCEKFTHVDQSRFGKVISGVQRIEEWRATVGHHTFHRRKDLKDYPPKTRQALEVEMEPWQKKIHDQLRKEMWAIWDDPDNHGQQKMVIAPNTLAATMKIRQFLVCPKILDDSFGYGAGLEGIWADVEEAELTHYVITTPFRAAIPHIEQFLSARGHGSTVFAGGIYSTANELQNAIALWTKRGGAAIQTVKFAESYELPAARIMYMLGYEYSAEENSQAEDRIHRDIRVTPHPVDIYYVKNKESYEADLIDMMAEGADTNFAMMNRDLTEVFRRD